jgi:GDP-mannose 6-dehydrogenase
VGTPSKGNGGLDPTYVKSVCKDIGQAIAMKDSFHTVILRSTVLPGTTREVVIPALENAVGKATGLGFGICHNPEFLREGTSVHDFYHPPFTVIGEFDSHSAKVVANLYENLDAPLLVVSLEVAEMIKYACNAFHALKIAFANEVGNLCKSQGINSHQVMDVFCMDEKLNLSSYYLKPGFAFGGSCLPKDLRALLHYSRRKDLELPVLESILPSNELQIRRGIEMVKQTGSRNIGVLGFSFKPGTDDLRESPVVEIIETLLGKGYHVKIYDRSVSLARLVGANREYIEREIPHIASIMCSSLEELLKWAEIVVVAHGDPTFRRVLSLLREDQRLIDLVGIFRDSTDIRGGYEGICW